jgi:hypothetical protein
MTLEEQGQMVAASLTDDPEEQENLVTAFTRALHPFDEPSLIPIQESYSYVCMWLPYASRGREKAENGDKTNSRFVERFMQAAAEALKTSLMSYMANLKAERGNQ